MKRKKERKKPRNGIYFHSDIDFALSDDEFPATYFIRVLVAAAASLAAVFMTESFLETEFIVTANVQIFLSVIFTAVSVRLISSRFIFFKLFGSGYLILNAVFLISRTESAVTGMLFAVYSYTKKARMSIPFFSSYASLSTQEDINACFLTVTFLLALMISIACVYKTNFPLLFIFTFPIFELGAFWGWEPWSWTIGGMLLAWTTMLSLNLINHTTKKKKSKSTFAVYPKKNSFYLTSDAIKLKFFTVGALFAAVTAMTAFSLSVIFAGAISAPRAFRS